MCALEVWVMLRGVRRSPTQCTRQQMNKVTGKSSTGKRHNTVDEELDTFNESSAILIIPPSCYDADVHGFILRLGVLRALCQLWHKSVVAPDNGVRCFDHNIILATCTAGRGHHVVHPQQTQHAAAMPCSVHLRAGYPRWSASELLPMMPVWMLP